MLIIVTYDVSTETGAGRRRLRRVAKTCESMGQRVQKSVFECQVNEMQYEKLLRNLLAEIDEQEDSLRFYRITEPTEIRVKEYGKNRLSTSKRPWSCNARTWSDPGNPGRFAITLTCSFTIWILLTSCAATVG